MMSTEQEGVRIDEVTVSESIVLTLQEFAGRFGYSNTSNFRSEILDKEQVSYKRLSLKRFLVPLSQLPAQSR